MLVMAGLKQIDCGRSMVACRIVFDDGDVVVSQHLTPSYSTPLHPYAHSHSYNIFFIIIDIINDTFSYCYHHYFFIFIIIILPALLWYFCCYHHHHCRRCWHHHLLPLLLLLLLLGIILFFLGRWHMFLKAPLFDPCPTGSSTMPVKVCILD